MKTKLLSTIALSALVVITAASAANAQVDPGHPRVTEVNDRDQNQQNRIDAGVQDGQINAKQAARDEKRLNRVENQEHKDEAKNGGHLTKKEDKKLNKELNNNSGDIYNQRHN